MTSVFDILKKWDHNPEHILSILLDVQESNPQHYLDEQSIEAVAQGLRLTKTRVYEIASFFEMLHINPHGRHELEMCHNTPCWFNGGKELAQICEKKLGTKFGTISNDGSFSLSFVSCYGHCADGPGIKLDGKRYGRLTPESLEKILDALVTGEVEA